ncbi:MAG TPA: DoxX family protein [Blastocatellia bacterium]|nr:DoxX family protein [Blastocatellia bacterium]
MISDILLLRFFEKYKEYAALFIRVIVGSFIVYGVQDNVFSSHDMERFAAFLEARGTPYPMFAAFLSAYTQMICGVCIALGAAIRLVSIPFIINFVAAIVIAHRGDTFQGMFPALMMIFAGLFFLFNGAGKPSVDDWVEKRRAGRAALSLAG